MQLVAKISNLRAPDPPTSQTDRQTGGRTDGRTTCECDHNTGTALCTIIVHRAVKTEDKVLLLFLLLAYMANKDEYI